METLIARLAKVESGGFGYNGTFSGSEFLPVPGSGEATAMVLTRHDVAPSDAMRQLVSSGIKAVPFLIKHLDDARPTRIKPLEAMMWMQFADEYDRNERLLPRNVKTRDRLLNDFPDKSEPYRLTVGDLAFVALGQIVNRSFSAARYQPTGGLVVNSPSRSPALRRRVIAEWKGLTATDHRERLIRDLTTPDNERRRIGAYQRLAFYYPKVVEPLVLKELNRPTYDVFVIERFAHEILYGTRSKQKRKSLFDGFLEERGRAAADGLLLQLFHDLETLEADEEKRLSSPLKDFRTQPRDLLIQLYGKPASIRSSAKPFVNSVSTTGQARFIAALTLDNSARVDAAIAHVKASAKGDDYLTNACKHALDARAKRHH